MPDTLVWERVGSIEDVYGLFFDGDTLYAIPLTDPVQVLRPGDEDFSQAFANPRAGQDLSITTDRTIFLRASSASLLKRSTDWGESFLTAHEDALSLPVETPSGALALGVRGTPDGTIVARSTDGGATWTDRGLGTDTRGIGTTAVLVLPPAPAAPEGRLLASGYAGAAYSDDDGLSWEPTNLYTGGLGAAVWSVARTDGGPLDGRLIALVQGNGEAAALWGSDDGASFEPVGPLPEGAGSLSRLVAAPGGVVYLWRGSPEGVAEGGQVWGSVDGGVTWRFVGPVWSGWEVAVTEVVVGPQGRLWASATGPWDAEHPEGGVFRTVEAVVTAAEAEPSEPAGARLEAWPNPSGGSLTVALTLAEPGAVRVAVYDVAGREVAVLHEGSLSRGPEQLVLSEGLSSGVYVVRATVGAEVLTRRVTVLR